MLKYMLDTNIVIYVIKRRPIEVLATFNKYAGQMCISSITLAELLHGVEKSFRPEHNLQKTEDFISRLEVLEYTTKAATHYGNIRACLEKQGNTIGVNDLHIAGHRNPSPAPRRKTRNPCPARKRIFPGSCTCRAVRRLCRTRRL